MTPIRLRQGYDIPLAGVADPRVEDAPGGGRVALRPDQFRGYRPRLLVEEGDTVKLGTPLVYDRDREDYRLCAPAAGKVVAIERGYRRALNAIVIEPDGSDAAVEFDHWAPGGARDNLLNVLRQSGMLAVFTQRPFGNLPDPNAVPRDIFVSTFDTAPLAADQRLVLAGNEAAFQAGVDAAAVLTSGRVHLGIDAAAADVPAAFAEPRNAVVQAFRGPHPAGNVGVQIHHVAPIRSRQDVVWTTTVQGLILLGRLVTTGRLDLRTVVAVTGSAAAERRYVRTTVGACLGDLAAATDGVEARWISGDVLTGSNVGAAGFLGLGDTQVCLLPEAVEPEFWSWAMPGLRQLSRSRSFLSSWLPGRLATDTRLHGGRRALVVTGWFERVLPMDIHATFLVKSILAGDIEEMEGLGIYELLEEDMALCEYVDPSKSEIQAILRQGLDLIEKEG